MGRALTSVLAIAPFAAWACAGVLAVEDATYGPPSDAGVPAESAAVDAPASSDVSVPSDASPPTDQDADAGLGFCLTNADAATTLLCDDFDQPARSQLVDTGWTSIFGFPLGELATDVYLSRPRSSRFTFGGDAGPGRAGAEHTVPFPPTATTLTLQAKLHPRGAFATQAGARLLAIAYGGCSFEYFAAGGLTAFCPESIPGVNSAGLQADHWTTVRVGITKDVDLVTVTIDTGEGGNLVQSRASVAAHVIWADTSATVRLGCADTDISGVVEIDDVLVEAH